MGKRAEEFRRQSKKRFDRNLKAFAIYNRHLVDRLKTHDPEKQIYLGPSNTLDITDGENLLFGGDAEQFATKKLTELKDNLIHLATSPPEPGFFDRFTNPFVAGITRKARENGWGFSNGLPVAEPFYLFIFGAGLGHHLDRIIDLKKPRVVFIFEPDLDTLYLSLFTYDWAGLFERFWQNGGAVYVSGNEDIPIIIASVQQALHENCPAGLDGSPCLILNNAEYAQIVLQNILQVGPLLLTGVGFLYDETVILGRGHSDVDAKPESYMHFQITQQQDSALREIAASLKAVLDDVRAAVEDWRPMRERMETVIEDLAVEPRGIQMEESAEVRELLRWLYDNHFTFLGFREFKISGSGKKTRVTVDRAAGLGVLRDPKVTVFESFQAQDTLSPEIAEFLSRRDLLSVTKTNQRSVVHRSVHMDAIGIKKIDKKGKVVGHQLFVGLFTSVAYNLSPRNIPLLRRRLQNIVDQAGYSRDSHDGKALLNILETYPRDELFQIKEDALFEIATGILHLQERQRVALFVREDAFKRYLSCMVFVPRDRYDTGLRQKIQEILADAVDGEPSAFFTQLGDSPLARVHLIIKMMGRKVPKYDVAALEAKIADATRSWGDRVLDALTEREGEARAHALHARFKKAFGLSYQAQYSSDEVLF